ncbi:reverse transcriptase domain-containing protein [Artemisia annua]|uniref:Reverse transcriptase domain-containing protein n=1 Tax=Artemisia annua TaxID=35608 RepID=A0A2U1M7C6_ARTAN|nr:reverse transcriptase domain-containing protein [Artemisia annua]
MTPENPPRVTAKQAQNGSEGAYSLEVRLEALIKFLSKGAYGPSSFFKNYIMGNCKTTFRWSKEAEAAFQRWKECMEILPTFTVPDHNEALFLHLATPSGGINAILLAKRRGIYIPIYFANRTLHEIEQTYTKTERLILPLVNAARCLRKYFQEHPIRVFTDKPIRRILSHPNKSRRIVKWALELEEHSIEYQKEGLADGQMPTSVLSASNQISTPTKKELHGTKRTNKIPSGGSKAVRITVDQSSTKSLRSGEGRADPNLFVPKESEPPARRNMKVSGSPALTEPIPLIE